MSQTKKDWIAWAREAVLLCLASPKTQPTAMRRLREIKARVFANESLLPTDSAYLVACLAVTRGQIETGEATHISWSRFAVYRGGA